MKFECEYTVTIKLGDVYMREGHSSDEIRDKIMLLGKENLKRYFNNVLFDPNKKVIFEETKFKLKEV
jgi:hypothetical protein